MELLRYQELTASYIRTSDKTFTAELTLYCNILNRFLNKQKDFLYKRDTGNTP